MNLTPEEKTTCYYAVMDYVEGVVALIERLTDQGQAAMAQPWQDRLPYLAALVEKLGQGND